MRMNDRKQTPTPLNVCILALFVPLLASAGISDDELPGIPVKLLPKPGESVEVKYLGSWLPGVVKSLTDEEVEVEFTRSGKSRERSFELEDVRYTWQPRAISPVYVWTDASGEHTVQAAVEEIDEETQQVTLIRRDDGKPVILPIASLGTLEQRRIRILIRQAPPKVAQVPTLEEFVETEQLVSSGLGAPTSLASLSVDPPKIREAMPVGGAAFPRAYSKESLVGVFPIGSARGWIVGATLPEGYSSNSDAPTRLVWATLDDGKIVKQHLLAPNQRTLAIDAGSQQIVTLGEVDDNVPTLTVWKSSPKLKDAEPVVRWTSGNSRSYEFANRWGTFINHRIVLHRINRGEYAAYDFVAKQTLYKFGQDTRNMPEPALSPGRRYLAIPEEQSVRIVQPDSGKVLASLPVQGGAAASVAFDSAGEHLAVLSQNEMAIWTFGTSQGPRRVRADLLLSASRLTWVNENLLLIGGNVLFSLDQALPVWSYSADRDVVRNREEPNSVAIQSGRLCYGVRLGNPYDRNHPSGFVIGAVDLPGPGVVDTVAGLNRDELYVLKPGTPVALSVDCGQYDDRVRANLLRHIKANQWELSPSAEIQIKAIMDRLPPQESIYIKDSSPFGIGRISFFGPTQKQLNEAERIVRQSYRSILEINRDEESIWYSSQYGAIPSSLTMREGQSVEAVRQQYEKPIPEFFDTVRIPGTLYNPRYRNGFGKSYFGKHGLDPKPLTDLPVQ